MVPHEGLGVRMEGNGHGRAREILPPSECRHVIRAIGERGKRTNDVTSMLVQLVQRGVLKVEGEEGRGGEEEFHQPMA